MSEPSSFPFCVALRHSMKGYSLKTFYHDALAALVVSLIALPLSIGLSIAVGLPPQHGIYTAIVAGAIVPLLGGSRWQVSGPTAAFVVILAPIVTEFGLRGIIWAGMLAGVILLVMGWAKLGRLVSYIPYPVTTGFTAGIAVVLATLSLNNFFGLGIGSLSGSFIEKLGMILMQLPSLDMETTVVGVVTLVLMFTGERFIRFVPSAATAILAGTLLSMLFAYLGHDVPTLGSEFSYVASDGSLLPGIPPYPPMLHLPTLVAGELFTIPSLEEWRHLLFPAFAIAILAALESLLSAIVADSMAGTRHDPNAELGAIGVGNILSGLATGIPATGAIARTATSIHNGAKTPLASTMHALLILAYVLVLAPYISYIPMAALAALLINTAYRMSHIHHFVRIVNIAPKSDVIVLLICFALTVFIDMVAGVGVGMVCAALLLIKRVTELTSVDLEEHGSHCKLPEGVMLYRIRGPVFFGTVEKAFDRYNFVHDHITRFIVDLTDVPFMDITGMMAMKSMLVSIGHEKRRVCIVGNTPEVMERLKLKMAGHPAEGYVGFYGTVAEALVA